MTEAEWLASEDPEAMYEVVAEGAFKSGYGHVKRTERKRTFFSAACCRLVWPWVAADDRCRRAVEYLETHFDLAYSEAEVDEIWGDVKTAARHPEGDTPLFQRA